MVSKASGETDCKGKESTSSGNVEEARRCFIVEPGEKVN